LAGRRHLGSNHAFLVIASDGVFEFISSQRVVDMVSRRGSQA
jgi:serine/threonine protein phosphatase PrpC